MAQLEQSLSKIITFLFIWILASCNVSDKEKMMSITDGNFHAENGIMYLADQPYSGYLYQFYPNGKDTAAVQGYFEGKENGIWKKFYDNGTLQEKRIYKNGVKEGELLTLWPDGKKQKHYQFKNDEYDGSGMEWNADGQVILALNYKNGHEDGPQKMFYDNGKVRSNYIIINGRRYGLLGTKNCVNVSDSIFKN